MRRFHECRIRFGVLLQYCGPCLDGVFVAAEDGRPGVVDGPREEGLKGGGEGVDAFAAEAAADDLDGAGEVQGLVFLTVEFGDYYGSHALGGARAR